MGSVIVCVVHYFRGFLVYEWELWNIVVRVICNKYGKGEPSPTLLTGTLPCRSGAVVQAAGWLHIEGKRSQIIRQRAPKKNVECKIKNKRK